MSITLNANALTTLARFRALAVEGARGTDDQIVGRINAMSTRLETFCGRKFGYRKYLTTAPQLLKGNGLQQLYLDRNIRNVQEIKINGASYGLEVVSGTSQLPLYGATVYRTPDWDMDGMLYCPIGFTLWAGSYRDLTHDINLQPLQRLYNVQVAWEGGWILPGFSGQVDVTNNPENLATDLPADLEQAVCQEIENRMLRPNRSIIREKTPGGTDTQYNPRVESGEFGEDTLAVFLSYRTPRAVFS